MYHLVKWIRSDGNFFLSKIGRRGLILVLTGMIWILYGIDFLSHYQHRFSMDDVDPLLVYRIIDQPYTGLLWILCGAVAMTVGVLRNRIKLIPHDSLGFNAILFPAILWTFLYFWSWIYNLFSDGQYGVPTATGFLVWLLVTIFVLIIAGWADPTDPTNVLAVRQETT